MPVGRVSLFLSAAVLAPIILMIALGIYHHSGPMHIPATSLKGLSFPSFGMALYTVMWNCLGWDNVTTYAEEVEKPVRSYLISIFAAFALVMVVYFFAIWVAQQSGIDHDTLTENGFPALGVLIGGHWLGIVVAAGGMASTLGIYTAVLLSVSRVPQVMSEDNLLPKGVNKLHPRFKTPFVSIIICSIVVSFMVLWTFADLLIIDVTVYGAGLSLEYIALVKLRVKEPMKERPFRIPLSVTGLCLIMLLPFIVYSVALGGALSSTPKALSAAVFALVALSSAEVAWQIIKLSKPELKQ